jgi:hypothetical protein
LKKNFRRGAKLLNPNPAFAASHLHNDMRATDILNGNRPGGRQFLAGLSRTQNAKKIESKTAACCIQPTKIKP